MEYIEYDIKSKIQELLNGRVIPHSIELDCERVGSTLTRIYGTNVYSHPEQNGYLEVEADFHCTLLNALGEESNERGSFSGRYNIEQKHFEDDGFAKVTI